MVRVKHHIGAYHQLRSAPGVVGRLESEGRRTLSAAGGRVAGYDMGSQQGAKRPQGRWRVAVVTATRKAMRDNARNNTLLRALRSGQ